MVIASLHMSDSQDKIQNRLTINLLWREKKFGSSNLYKKCNFSYCFQFDIEGRFLLFYIFIYF